MITYLLQSLICLALTIITYIVFLKKEKAFFFNRFYLLISLALSLLTPLLKIENIEIINQSKLLYFNFNELESLVIESYNYTIPEKKTTLLYTPFTIIKYAYFIITSIFFIQFLLNLVYLKKIIRAKGKKIYNLQIILIDFRSQPFSFFKYLFINRKHEDELMNNKSLILHELAHYRQLHSIDIIFIELIKCVFWFNPMVWLYKKYISENHEYLADRYASSQQSNLNQYSLDLLQFKKEKTPIALTIGFSYLQIKNRIKMLHKSENNMLKPIKIAISITFAISALTISSFKVNEQTTIIIKEKIGFIAEEETNEKTVPYLFPIKKNNISKVSSGFGIRVHPIKKIKKIHSGIDFIAKKGTPILATANGVIVLTTYTEAYGNHIIIEHSKSFQTIYAHLEIILVEEGEKIIGGNKIGIIGNTGKSLGTHLHYEVIKNGKKVDPKDFLGD